MRRRRTGWRSRPRPPRSSGRGPAGRRVRELGEFSGQQPELLEAAASETPRGQRARPPGFQLARGPRRARGCGEPSAGETKAARPGRGGGRTGASAAPPRTEAGRSSRPRSPSGQRAAANALARGIASHAVCPTPSRSSPTLRGCFAVRYRARRKAAALKSPLGATRRQRFSSRSAAQEALRAQELPEPCLDCWSHSFGWRLEFRIWHSLYLFPLLLPSLLSFYGPRGRGRVKGD